MYSRIIFSNGSTQYVTCIDIVKTADCKEAVESWKDSLRNNGMAQTIYTEECSEVDALSYFDRWSKLLNKPFSEINKAEKILLANEMILLN